MPKISTQHPTEWFVRSTWTINIFFPRIAISFSFRARREQFWHFHWVFFGKQRKIFPQIPEIFLKLQTHPEISSKTDSGHVQLSSDKLVVNLWPKERTVFVQKAEKSKTSNFTNEYLYKKHKKVLRICPREGKYKFWHLARSLLRFAGEVLAKVAKNHLEFKLLPETNFPHHILLETKMHYWQPAEKVFVKFQKENEIEKFQTQPLFVWTQTKRNVLTNLSKFFPQRTKKLLLTMQNVN